MQHPSYYYRALPEATRAALDLKLEALALAREACPDLVKIARYYRAAVDRLPQIDIRKAVNDDHSTYYIWITKLEFGGWGAHEERVSIISKEATNRVLRIYGMSFPNVISEKEITRALKRLEDGDFTYIDSYVHAGYTPSPHVKAVLASLGCASVMRHLDVTELKQFIPEKIFRVLNRYARVSPSHTGEVIRVLEATGYADKFIQQFLKQFNPALWSDPINATMYLVGSVRSCTLSYIEMLNTTVSMYYCRRSYEVRVNAYRKSAIAWLCCARRLGICRDITIMIGKMIFAARYEFA